MLKAVEACQPPGAKEHTYPRLKRAAICIEAEAPGKAVEYLKNAEPLIPADDKEEAFRLYTRLAAALAKLKDYDAALATQQRCIQRTGRGLAGVGRAHLARGDKDEVRKVLESLMSPGSNEEDVLDLARDLAAAREGGMAIELLGAYLTVERPRDPVCELEARFLAGQVYALRRRRQEAVEVLAVEHLEKHLRTTAQRLSYKNALALRASLAQQAPEEPKVK
jgi:tetratricopeptide (TPR) repeat protein